MKNIRLLVIYLGLIPAALDAQNETLALHAQFDQTGRAQSPSTVPVFDNRYEGIKGSRYTVDEYSDGEIWLTKDRHYTTPYKYRFDEVENSIQVKYPEGKELLLFNNQVYKAIIQNNGRLYTYIKANVPGVQDAHVFYQLLYEGKNFKLIKFPLRKIKRVDEKTPLSTGRLYDEVQPYYKYFIMVGDKPYTEIKFKKKDFLKSIPQKKAQLEELFNTPQYKGDIDDIKIAEILKTIDDGV